MAKWTKKPGDYTTLPYDEKKMGKVLGLYMHKHGSSPTLVYEAVDTDTGEVRTIIDNGMETRDGEYLEEHRDEYVCILKEITDYNEALFEGIMEVFYGVKNKCHLTGYEICRVYRTVAATNRMFGQATIDLLEGRYN